MPFELWIIILAFACAILAGISKGVLWIMQRAGASSPAPVSPRQQVDTKSVASQRNLQAQEDASMVIPIAQWLKRVNEQPDKVPHVAATGASGSGKTTLITAILATRNDTVVVITPKPDDDWGGVPFITIDDDLSFRSVEKASKAIESEIRQRWVAVKHAKRDGKVYKPDWLTVVIDDYPYLARKIEGLADTVLAVARMGRSMRVRLILLAQEASVKAWGFEGEGEARDNFVFMDLPEAHWENGGAVMYRWSEQKTPQTIDTWHVYELSKRAISPLRWHATIRGDTGINGAEIGNNTSDTDTGIDGIDDMEAKKQFSKNTKEYQIEQMIEWGWSANKIYDALGGNRNDVLALIREVRGETVL